MALQFVPATSLYILSAIVTFTLAVFTWRKKPERGFTWFMVLVCATIWTIGTFLETIFSDLETKFLVIRTVPYIGITGTVFFWALFTIIYSRHKYWLNKFTIGGLALVPVTIYLLVLTSNYHPLIWESYWNVEQGGAYLIDTIHGIGFWIWAVYAYLVILLGALLIITAVIRSPRLYQGQAVMLILGALIPLISNLLFLTGLNPIAPLDISPISFTITGILITIGVVRFRLFNMLPVAHDLVFKGVTSGVIVIDLQGLIIDLNPAAEIILDKSKNELVGQNALSAFPEYDSLIHQYENVWEVKTEVLLGRNNRTYELQIMPLTNRSGHKVEGRIILLYNITERKRAIAERDRLIGELDAYAHTVAHDLKTPLSVVMGYSSLIKRIEQDNLSDSSLKLLDTIAQTSKKMGEIIDSLLLLANINSMDKVEKQPLSMAEIVGNAWGRVTKKYEDEAIEFIIPEPEAWPTAVGFEPWVEQIWVNYLSNAIKYGGSPPRVEVGFDEPNLKRNGSLPSVRFWVKDNGAGLSTTETEQLFQEFARLDQHKSVGGHGLGLSIVQRIVERLDGKVGIESELGQGSKFYFTLPLAQAWHTVSTQPPQSEETPVNQ